MAKVETFATQGNENVSHDVRLRSLSAYAQVLMTHGTSEFDKLALVPIEEKTTERSEFRGAAKHTV